MRLNDFAGVQLPVIFVDQFNQEYSRDIEPLAEGHADSYYYQLVDSVRHYITRASDLKQQPTKPKRL